MFRVTRDSIVIAKVTDVTSTGTINVPTVVIAEAGAASKML